MNCKWRALTIGVTGLVVLGPSMSSLADSQMKDSQDPAMILVNQYKDKGLDNPCLPEKDTYALRGG